MKDLAPQIYRQRLIIEGIYDTHMSTNKLKTYMKNLSKKLAMTIVYGPIARNLAGKINPVHEGYEAILIWAESGVSVYTWKKQRFFTVDIYSCKEFDNRIAVELTKEFFNAKEIDFKCV